MNQACAAIDGVNGGHTRYNGRMTLAALAPVLAAVVLLGLWSAAIRRK
jgi:hypothetical protein